MRVAYDIRWGSYGGAWRSVRLVCGVQGKIRLCPVCMLDGQTTIGEMCSIVHVPVCKGIGKWYEVDKKMCCEGRKMGRWHFAGIMTNSWRNRMISPSSALSQFEDKRAICHRIQYSRTLPDVFQAAIIVRIRHYMQNDVKSSRILQNKALNGMKRWSTELLLFTIVRKKTRTWENYSRYKVN